MKKKKESFLEWFIRDRRINFEARWENSFKKEQIPNHPAFKRGGEMFDCTIKPYIEEAYAAGKKPPHKKYYP